MPELKILLIAAFLCFISCTNNEERKDQINYSKENPEFTKYKNLISENLEKSDSLLETNPDSSLVFIDSCFFYCNQLDSLGISEDGGEFLKEKILKSRYNKSLALIELNRKEEGYELMELITEDAPELTVNKLCEYFFNEKKWEKSINYCELSQCEDCLYKIAYSRFKIDGKIAAIEFLKEHINSTNDEEVKQFYDKLNPIYTINEFSHSECCDGSTSHSRGRGTCSHHGGVCGEAFKTVEKRKY